MNALRITMAVFMAALVPLWCCCVTGPAQAAAPEIVVDSTSAANSCCESKREKPAPEQPAPEKPTENNDPCECAAEAPQPPVVSQAPGLPGLELVQSLLAFVPLSHLNDDPGLSLKRAGHGPVHCDGPPDIQTLLGQHTLLLI